MAKTKGLVRFNKAIDRMPDEVAKAIEPALMKSADEIANQQRALVPVQTGALRDSIAVTGPGETTPDHSQPGGSTTVPKNSAVVTAGDTDARYAHLVEFGTPTAQASPYFWPAYRLLRKRSQSRISRALTKAIKDGWSS